MVQNSQMLAGNDTWVGWLVPFPFFCVSISAFSFRSAPVQHLAGWEEEEQQGETDTVLVSFTLLLLLILKGKNFVTFCWKHPSTSESLICEWPYYSFRIDSLFVCVLLIPVCSGSLCWSWEFCWSRWPAWAGTLFGTQ